MSSKITVIPIVKAQGIKILNIKTGEISFTNIDNILPDGETIEITWNRGQENQKAKIWKEIEPRLIERLDEIKNYGMSEYGLDNGAESEPIIIDIGNSREYLEKYYGTTLRGDYRIIQIDNTKYTNKNSLSLDRIFLSAPPRLARGECEFFQPDLDDLLKFEGDNIASCGFQYFYQNFKKDTGRRKFVNFSKGRDRNKTGAKNSFDKIKWYCQNDPPQFEIWSKLYQNFINKRLSKKINTVDNEIAKEIVREFPEISVINLNPTEWTKEQIHNSMSIEDIVRMCMWMDLNLEIYDDIDEMVLCYSRDNVLHKEHKTMEKRGSVVVKVRDNHGYFVKNGDPVKYCVAGGTFSHTAFYPNDRDLSVNITDSKKVEINTIDTQIIKHPRVEYFWNNSIYNWGEAFYTGELPEEPTAEEFRKYKIKIEAPYYADNPPPTPEELISMMSGENTLFYTGANCLNGLVNYLKKSTTKQSSIEWVSKDGKGYWKINKVEIQAGYTPLSLRGSTTSIKKATYGKLNICTANCRPDIHYRPPDLDGGLNKTEDIDTEEAEEKCIDAWKERYPQLKVSSIPAPSQIGQAVFDDFKFDCYSCFNSRLRKILFGSEIKPYYRYTPPTHNFACAFSLDFSKAYSNALRFMDCEWSVFDAIDEPRLFREGMEFVDNAFYLCQELETGFPYKDLKDKGLALYHGCLLRHLLDKVKPIYIINSHKKLPANTFTGFVDKCYELAGDGKDNIVSGKQLVNNTLGNLKRKSGIKDYKLYLNTGVSQINKHLFEGFPVYNLDRGGTWRNTNYITAKGKIQQHFMSGQPIRLQVIDRINELNLLLDTAVRKSLNRDIHLILEKTDALYYQYPDGAKWDFKEYYWRNFNFDPVRDLDLGAINSQLPEGYEVKLERPVDNGLGFSERPIEVDAEKWGEVPTEISQYPVLSVWRNWRNRDIYREGWDVDKKLPKILEELNDYGGILIRGEAGTGKTEIIKGIDEICADNRSIHKFGWVRLFCKLLFGIKEGQKVINDWKTDNPCFIRKFAPTNKACNNIGGQTLHRGLGLKVINNSLIDDEEGGEEEIVDNKDRTEKLIKILESKPPDIAVFDEIGMIDGGGWSLISYIKYRIPSIKIILCGDIERQLAPVGEENRIFTDSMCIKELAGFNVLNLLYNFRRKGDANKLWTDWSINPQKFKVDDLPLTERNICRFNKTRKKVIDLVQDSHPDPVLWLDCPVGEDLKNIGCNKRLMISYDTPLIARVSMRDRGIAKNEIWRVDKIGNDTGLTEGYSYGLSSLDSDGVVLPMICLKFKDKEEWFSHDDIKKCWLSAYCITIHKSQGDTYNDEYTIWDWEELSKYRYGDNRRLRYVAQSRSTNPETLIRYK